MITDDDAAGLFDDGSSMVFDMNKWVYATILPSVNDAFGKYTSVSKEEREIYFRANNVYPNVHVLCNTFVPFDVFLYDSNGYKAKIPIEVLTQEFIIDESNSDQFFESIVYFPQVNHLRDKFYSLSRSIERLRLTDEDQEYVFFSCLSGLLDARIQIYRNYKHACNPINVDIGTKDLDVDLLRLFIDFTKLSDCEITEIYEQSVFFRECLTMPVWQELYSAIDKSIDFIRKWLIESVTNQLVESAEDKRRQIAEMLFRVDSAIDIHLFDERTRDVKFLKLERSLLQKANEAIVKITSTNQENFQKMSNTYNFNAPINQAVIESIVTDSTFESNLPNYDAATLGAIRNDLEELQAAVIEHKDVYEAISNTLQEMINFERSATKEVQMESAKKVVSWFQRLKDLKDLTAITFLSVDIQQKWPNLIEQVRDVFGKFTQ